MIYSATRDRLEHQYLTDTFTHVKNYTGGTGVFYYHELDQNLYGLKLADAFPNPVWLQLREDRHSRLLIDFSGDFIHRWDCDMINQAIADYRLDPQQVWIMVMDANFVEFVRAQIPGANVSAYNYLLNRIEPPPIMNLIGSKRFSVLSRNYRPWRMELYIRLLYNGALANTLYSFHNIDPYSQTKPSYTLNELRYDAQIMGMDPLEPKLAQWIAGVPYDLPEAPITNKWATVTYKTVRSAAVNLLIESHFDPFIYAGSLKGTDPRLFSPAFPTEKTYKTIACARPFIAVTTPYFLEDMRKLGYKTFSPYIDESYDTIEDNDQRMLAIANEVERLNKLSPEEFKLAMDGCAEAVVSNYYTLIQQQANNQPWDWLKEYVV